MRPNDESRVAEEAGPTEDRARHDDIDDRLNEWIRCGSNKLRRARVEFAPCMVAEGCDCGFGPAFLRQ